MPDSLIGDYHLSLDLFDASEALLQSFSSSVFREQPLAVRFESINRALLNLIVEQPAESFLLAAVLDFIDKVDGQKILEEPYTFLSFEFWLNHFSGADDTLQRRVRGLITGRYVPREEYQLFFPIGAGKHYHGTHFVTAHLSPDVDTMVASFFGWIDAFAARISTGQHLWSLPGGPPPSATTEVFKTLFGDRFFALLPRLNPTVTLSAMDLVTNRALEKELGDRSISGLDHGYHDKAVVLVDEAGYYIGDWHSTDAELVRQVIVLFKACLAWYENDVHLSVISWLGDASLNAGKIKPFAASLAEPLLSFSEPVQSFSAKQHNALHTFLTQILSMEKGLHSSYGALAAALKEQGVSALHDFLLMIPQSVNADLFSGDATFGEKRPQIFGWMQKVFDRLDKAILEARDWVEKLDVAMKIKAKVIGSPSLYLTLRSDVEEIRAKIKDYDYLTVVSNDGTKGLFPLGVVWNADLRRIPLGTVTWRDFGSADEVRMAPYLSLISIIDHHKSTLATSSVPMALIGDAQSCNVLVAELSLQINDRYSTAGISEDRVDDELHRCLNEANRNESELSLSQRLLQRKAAFARKGSEGYFVHPKREMAEYLLFLQAILDDTDLLTKVTARDVDCVATLINRVKSLVCSCESVSVDLSALPRDDSYAKKGAELLLQNDDLYSLYARVYAAREREIEESLLTSTKGQMGALFSDTKEQNRCCRIGQTKLFSTNFDTFRQMAPHLRKWWLTHAQQINRDNPQVDLHMHMISTIASAEEVYSGHSTSYAHRDELWIWIPPAGEAYEYLSSFLLAFAAAPEVLSNSFELELLGSDPSELKQLFERNFLPIPTTVTGDGLAAAAAVLRFNAGTLNSRKAAITPYLPRPIGNN